MTAEPSATTPHPPTSRAAKLSVSTTTLEVGGRITVSGTDCPEGHLASASLLPNNPNDGPAIFDTSLSTGGDAIETLLLSNGATRVTAASNGTWIIHAKVPMVFPGPSVVIAICQAAVPKATPSTAIRYGPDHVSVSTPNTLSLRPGTMVTPGSTLTVRARRCLSRTRRHAHRRLVRENWRNAGGGQNHGRVVPGDLLASKPGCATWTKDRTLPT